ncbi:MAG: hypothetical protein GEU90_17275 [Gemmatimonas sp.]|nr:hypothetical protein [Gemmatimonas sp.]
MSSLGAQDDETAESDTTATVPEIPVADTLSMTAAEAVANSLAVNTGDSAGQVATDTTAAASEPVSAPAPAPASRYSAGEDPAFAERYGWPVEGPATLPGAILPANRIVCYYGNPNSTGMGALGQYPKDEMLTRLRDQIAEWEQADPDTPVKPCLHMVSSVAQGEPGTAGHYRAIMLDDHVEKVYDWAKEVGGILIVDLQVGTDDVRNVLPRFEWILKNPDVHVGVDPEFYMKDGTPPGRRIGRMDAADINYVSEYLANLVREHDLPPKVFIVHRFTKGMVTNYSDIRLRPEVQVVMHMDGWGAPWLKQDSYRDYIVREPVQYPGFKIFYGNDTKTGTPIMEPEDLLRLRPTPAYIQYQ